ncbi:uncharacterized protein LOC133445713 [Cololabis saira]|uniref:uncharacterized protein LOC133445713 n=1 Tax=Cololabis saira TaxID=129043 RepID=UPI002AD370E9|nr:uncharacterized protein LOC133445713 [Cololabis saira]
MFNLQVTVHKVTTGETFGADEELLKQVKAGLRLEFTSPQDSDVIIVFCPISSRLGSDVEAARRQMPESSGDKKIILVLMHHTRDVNYSVSGTGGSDGFQNVVLYVDVLFHESQPGLLTCEKNRVAVRQIQTTLAQHGNSIFCRDKKQLLKLASWVLVAIGLIKFRKRITNFIYFFLFPYGSSTVDHQFPLRPIFYDRLYMHSLIYLC